MIVLVVHIERLHKGGNYFSGQWDMGKFRFRLFFWLLQLIAACLKNFHAFKSQILQSFLNSLHAVIVGDTNTLLHTWSCINALDPFLDTREFLKLDAKQRSELDPTVVGNVSKTVLVVGKVVVAFERDFQDTV